MDTIPLRQLLKHLRLNVYFFFGVAFATVFLVVAGLIFLMPTPIPDFPELSSYATPTPLTQLPAEVKTTPVGSQYVPTGLPVVYQVQPGDSSWKIAQGFYGSGYNYVDIESANNLTRDAHLEVSQELIIPAAPVKGTNFVIDSVRIKTLTNQAYASTELPDLDTPETHLIAPGDTLWHIALNEFGNPYRWPEIYQLNRDVFGPDPDLIYPGVELKLPEVQTTQ